MEARQLKREAARRALEFVEDGMVIGLGTGSTAAEFVDLLGEKVRDGLRITGVPTSEATLKQALDCGITMATIEEEPEIDLTVDGADELDRGLRLVKGGGGALLREKIVASASEMVVIIADQSKLVERLGAFPLPVEVVPFGAEATYRRLVEVAGDFGCQGSVKLRMKNDSPFMTDGQHLIYDCAFGRIDDPEGLAVELNRIPGVVENGLFISMATVAVIGTDTGVRLLERAPS